jgi:SAM-dependent methyltransferase
VGLEISARAVEWARASATAQGVFNVRFERAQIPDFSPGGKFDLVVFNPPMAIPEGAPRPHRDGGVLGCELPGVFLGFALDCLRPSGEACFLATSPVIRGRSVFRERLGRKGAEMPATLVEAERLHSHFNQSLARKAGYAALGIERVELWYFRLRKAEG